MANNEDLNRTLKLTQKVAFRQGGKIHGKRLTAVKSAVDAAIEEVLGREFPDLIADVSSELEWSYVYREESSQHVVGDDDEATVVTK